jgi:hypothetical protein
LKDFEYYELINVYMGLVKLVNRTLYLEMSFKKRYARKFGPVKK